MMTRTIMVMMRIVVMMLRMLMTRRIVLSEMSMHLRLEGQPGPLSLKVAMMLVFHCKV